MTDLFGHKVMQLGKVFAIYVLKLTSGDGQVLFLVKGNQNVWFRMFATKKWG